MEPMSSPLRIATLDVALPQQARLSKLLKFPHEFVAPTEKLQKVDAVIALRFGTEQAQRFSTRLLHLPGAGADAVDFASLTRGCEVCNVFEHEIRTVNRDGLFNFLVRMVIGRAVELNHAARSPGSKNSGDTRPVRRP